MITIIATITIISVNTIISMIVLYNNNTII